MKRLFFILLKTLNIQKENYYIYKLNIGKNKVYIGSTNNYERRIKQHLKELQENNHHNSILQQAYLQDSFFNDNMCMSGSTYFHAKVLLIEQRLIDRYSNSNLAVASNKTELDKLVWDLLDYILERILEC